MCTWDLQVCMCMGIRYQYRRARETEKEQGRKRPNEQKFFCGNNFINVLRTEDLKWCRTLSRCCQFLFSPFFFSFFRKFLSYHTVVALLNWLYFTQKRKDFHKGFFYQIYRLRFASSLSTISVDLDKDGKERAKARKRK